MVASYFENGHPISKLNPHQSLAETSAWYGKFGLANLYAIISAIRLVDPIVLVFGLTIGDNWSQLVAVTNALQGNITAEVPYPAIDKPLSGIYWEIVLTRSHDVFHTAMLAIDDAVAAERISNEALNCLAVFDCSTHPEQVRAALSHKAETPYGVVGLHPEYGTRVHHVTSPRVDITGESIDYIKGFPSIS
jgi:hypothetical protein